MSLDFRSHSLVPLAQLQVSNYQADTIDLMQDAEARYVPACNRKFAGPDQLHAIPGCVCACRQYWLDCFASAIDREVQRAVETSGSQRRAQAFKQTYLQHVEILRADPRQFPCVL